MKQCHTIWIVASLLLACADEDDGRGSTGASLSTSAEVDTNTSVGPASGTDATAVAPSSGESTDETGAFATSEMETSDTGGEDPADADCWMCDDASTVTDRRVGIGTDDPHTVLHLASNDEVAFPVTLTIESTDPDIVDREMILLRNRGGSRIHLENTLMGKTWRISTPNNYGRMDFGVAGSGVVEMAISEEGNLSVHNDIIAGGTISEGSDVNIKENFQSVDYATVLEGVANLDVFEWNYIADDDGIRHFGPVAQDFFTAFGLGRDDVHIAMADIGGVAFASIRALKERLDQKDATIRALEARLDRLEQRFH